MARVRTAHQADQAMAHLADLSNRHDEAGFASALDAMDWSSRPADEVLRAVQLALMTGAFMAARRLSQAGADRYPAHAELQKYARVLAPPKVTRSPGPPDLTLVANHDCMKREADAYRGQWIALRNGELLATAGSFDALADQFPDPHGILMTKIF
jgi:hypothetical protein